MTDPFDVIIVGAGPTGTTAATLLGQRGVRCLLLDRWEDVYPQPRAVHLDDEVYRILDDLGIGEEFAAISRPALGLRLLSPDHRVLAEFRRDGLSPRSGHPRANMFDQPELERLLRRNLASVPSVTFRGGVEVTRVRSATAGHEVDLRDTNSGEIVSARGRFVLGCDGANSIVRDCIGGHYRDLRFQQRWLVIDVESTASLDQWEGIHQVCDSRRAATFMQIGPTRYRWEFQLLEGETRTTFTDLASVTPLISPWLPDNGPNQLELVRVAEYTFRAQIADKWREDGIFLLGDAAHLTPPFIGQGMGAGLRDAHNLAWKIAGVLDHSLPVSVLDSYEVERAAHVRSVISLAKVLGHVMTSGGRAGDRLRALAAPILTLVPGLRRRVTDSETAPLSGSTWVNGDRRDRLAGTLCPNLEIAGATFDRHAGYAFALVTTTAVSPELTEAMCAIDSSTIDVTDHGLAAWLHRAGARVALIRPDHTVLASAGTSAELADRLNAALGRS